MLSDTIYVPIFLLDPLNNLNSRRASPADRGSWRRANVGRRRLEGKEKVEDEEGSDSETDSEIVRSRKRKEEEGGAGESQTEGAGQGKESLERDTQ